MKKAKDLLIITVIYFFSFIVGYYSSIHYENIMLRLFAFDTIATVVVFVFSMIFKNSSVYDAYWSFTPLFMSIYLFIVMKAFSVWHVLFLIAFNIWAIRLTVNWIIVFTDFSYEDWRYIKFRNETPRIFWPIVNFFGIHYMPTLVVFLGMLPLFELSKSTLNVKISIGILIMLYGVLLEFLADRGMHRHLSTNSKSVCKEGLWKYSRHPNYLGEITFWLGVFISMLPFAYDKWYYGVGFIVVASLFEFVSIPLMEKRQLSRRPEYVNYQSETSRLLLLPCRKTD